MLFIPFPFKYNTDAVYSEAIALSKIESGRGLKRYSSFSWENAPYPKVGDIDHIPKDCEFKETEEVARDGKKYRKVLLRTNTRIVSLFPSTVRLLSDMFELDEGITLINVKWVLSEDDKYVEPQMLMKL